MFYLLILCVSFNYNELSCLGCVEFILSVRMYLQEGFVKTREQANAYLEMKGELTNGLNLINNTNLEYFPAKHKAEIFRLKGDFLLKLNDSEGANLAYSNAISLFKNFPKGWISWGNYCDMVVNSILFFILSACILT